MSVTVQFPEGVATVVGNVWTSDVTALETNLNRIYKEHEHEWNSQHLLDREITLSHLMIELLGGGEILSMSPRIPRPPDAYY